MYLLGSNLADQTCLTLRIISGFLQVNSHALNIIYTKFEQSFIFEKLPSSQFSKPQNLIENLFILVCRSSAPRRRTRHLKCQKKEANKKLFEVSFLEYENSSNFV